MEREYVIRSLLCILALFLMFWGAGFLHGRMKQHSYRLTMKLLLAVYMLFCLYMTLLSRTPKDFHPITFVPLSTFMRIIGLPVESWRDLLLIIDGTKKIGTPHLEGIDGMIQNIALFVPLGFLLPVLWKKFRKFSNTLSFCFGASLFIEMAQIFTYRATDINDLIANTLGGVLGYLLGRWAAKAFCTAPLGRSKDIIPVFSVTLAVLFFLYPLLAEKLWLMIF